MTTPPPPGDGTTPPPGYGPPPPGYGPPPPGYSSATPPGYATPMGSGAYASWGQRAGAAIIDALIGVAIVAVALILGIVLSNASSALGAIVAILGYLAALGFLIWQLVVQGQTGQTIGKKQLGIKLVREADGQVIGAGLSIGRYFVHTIDGIPCYLGYLWPLWDAKKQTFADKILATIVVKA